MKQYTDEMYGRNEFYDKFMLKDNIKYTVNCDGIYYGVLFEHKLNIDDLGKVLMQMIKYASKLRILGKLIPEKFIAIDLNREESYIFNSINYLDKIEKVYIGASSKNNEGLKLNNNEYETIDYSNRDGFIKLSNIIEKAKNDQNYTRYNVDFTNILQLSKEFYKIVNNKDKFINGNDCEIRKPEILKDRILPYNKENNSQFSSIMDCLNTNIQQSSLGAFYTPDPYVKLSQTMLLKRIDKLKDMGLDYIVIDRCAGTGNLYKDLPDDVLSKCILSTLEINEYLVLQSNFIDKSTVVVPPTDALSYDIIPTEIDSNGNVISDYIRERIKDPNCAIILLENPPYSESGGLVGKGHTDVKMSWKESFVCKEMKKEIKGVVSNDLSNLFIWSAFKYYLTKPFDSYILYSPIKYWKQQHLIQKKILDSFVCNRKHFHASEGAILCVHWQNVEENIESFVSNVYDINKDNESEFIKQLEIRKVYNPLSKLYDKRKFIDDTSDSILCEMNGLELNSKKVRNVKSTYNKNILAYVRTQSLSLSGNTSTITRVTMYDEHGFYLREDNYLTKLPLYVASTAHEVLKWFEKGTICKTSDLEVKSYLDDTEFIKKCFIFTCLTFRNKCRSLNGSDNRFYKNELCFDNNTIASNDLNKFTLTEEEQELINDYYLLLAESKKCIEYNSRFTYGTYQIQEEINIDEEYVSVNKNGKEETKKRKKYNHLNTMIVNLKKKIKSYYMNNIYNDLFKYGFLK